MTAECETAATDILKSTNPMPAPNGEFQGFTGSAFPTEKLIKEATERADAGNKERIE